MPTFLFFFAPIFLTPGSLLPVAAQLEEAQREAPVDDADRADEREAAPALPSVQEAEAAAGPTAQEQSVMAAQLARRGQMGDLHRAFGIATWVSMTATLVLGGIQISDEYGPFASAGTTPCAQGTAVFQGLCDEQFPWAHGVSAIATSALYYTTFTLSFLMPDPLASAESPGWGGERLRIHKTLRWLHFAGMVLTSLFGAVSANIGHGPDDFEARQALAITHFGLGLTTYGLLTAAAAVMIF